MATVFTPAPFTLSGGKFNLEILMTTAFPTGGDPPPGSVSSEPEPGYYVFEFSDPTAGTGHYEARVISPDRLEGQLNVAIEGCSISIPFVVTRTG
jgi:hypothetical protein